MHHIRCEGRNSDLVSHILTPIPNVFSGIGLTCGRLRTSTSEFLEMWLTHFLPWHEAHPLWLQSHCQSISSTIKHKDSEFSAVPESTNNRDGFKGKHVWLIYSCVAGYAHVAFHVLHLLNCRIKVVEQRDKGGKEAKKRDLLNNQKREKNPVERQLKHHWIMCLELGWVMWRENGGGQMQTSTLKSLWKQGRKKRGGANGEKWVENKGEWDSEH